MNEMKKPAGRPPNLKIRRLMKRHKCSRATAYRIAEHGPRVRIQSPRLMSERGLDPYFTPPEATISLLYLERAYLPRVILDPCAGDGAITKLMAQHGYDTYANDIEDYGLEGCSISDYLAMQPLPLIEGIVTNPPYKLAVEFLLKAIGEADYVAFLVRSMFLIEAAGRDAFLEEHPPMRVYHSSQRLPRMHHIGWTGRRSSSQTPYSWAVWDRRANHVAVPRRYRWRDIWAEYEGGRLDLGPMSCELVGSPQAAQ